LLHTESNLAPLPFEVADDGSRQQFYIHCNDQEVCGRAGVWDRSINSEGQAIESFAIIMLPTRCFHRCPEAPKLSDPLPK
jgi:hypothetical protein